MVSEMPNPILHFRQFYEFSFLENCHSPVVLNLWFINQSSNMSVAFSSMLVLVLVLFSVSEASSLQYKLINTVREQAFNSHY